MAQTLPLVSVLFISYKRFDFLKRAVETFLANTDYPHLELVVADDGSGAATQELIRMLPITVFALAEENRGLGANNNNGIRHCTGKYILMIQDDWSCHGPPDYLLETILIMERNPEVGLINFAGAAHPPDTSHGLPGSHEQCFVTPIPLNDGSKKYFLYTDQPHVKSQAALRHVGPYREDRDMEACERDYEIRWQEQKVYRTAVFPRYFHSVFKCDVLAPSFRENMFRHRVQTPLVPIAHFLRAHCRPAYVVSKRLVRVLILALEKLSIVR